MKMLQCLSEGAFAQHVDENESYEVDLYYLSPGAKVAVEPKNFRTYYVMAGRVEVTLNDEKGATIETRTIEAGNGWLLLPNQSQLIRAEQQKDAKIFAIKNHSPLSTNKIFERGKKVVLDDKVFNALSDYVVNKPWGSEQWFVDTDVYVFKGIRMNSGFECSLQLHEQKIEVNLILSGKAQLLLGQSPRANAVILEHHQKGGTQADFSMDEHDVEAIKGGIKPTLIGPDEGWKADRYDIHQILSLETYYALEVSTPEVDDIIRLKDLYHRPGGRINREHAAQGQASVK